MDGKGNMMMELSATLKRRRKESGGGNEEEEETKMPANSSPAEVTTIKEVVGISVKPVICTTLANTIKPTTLPKSKAVINKKTTSSPDSSTDAIQVLAISVLPVESSGEEVPDPGHQETSPDHGMLFKMIKLCLPKAPSTAIFLFILITFFLTASDAGSDIALGYFLYYRGFVREATIVIIADYATSILNILHFMTVSLQNDMSAWVTAPEIVMFLIFNPVAPAINCALWMIFRIAKNIRMIKHYMFLSKLTCLINGTFESPVQIILLLFFLITSRIQPPWMDTTEYTDSLGNKISLGSYLSVISFFFCWISLVKNVTDSYQSSKFIDLLTILAFVFPNVVFRIFSYTALVTQVREWIGIPVSLLFVLNFFIGGHLKPEQSGINLSSSSFCSIFCVVGMPNDPSIKDETGTTEMEPNKLKKLTLLITSVSLPLIVGFCCTAYFILPNYVNIKQDLNVPFTVDQEFFIMACSYSGIIVLCVFSCVLFFFVFNNPNVSDYLKAILNVLMISSTIVWLVLSYSFCPPSPNSLVLLVEKNNGGITIFEGFTYTHLEDGNCSISKINDIVLICGNTQIPVQLVHNRRKLKEMDKKIILLDPKPEESSFSETFKQKKVQVFQVQSNLLKAKLNHTKCIECHQKESNACRNMLYANQKTKICTSHCQRIPKTQGAFSTEEIDLRLLKSDYKESGREWIWNENTFMSTSVSIKVTCEAPKHFFDASEIPNCQKNQTIRTTECKVIKYHCDGNDEWVKEEKCRSCKKDQECKDIKKGNICQKGICFNEVLLVSINPRGKQSMGNVVFYEPQPGQTKLKSCKITAIPAYVPNSLVSFFKGVLQVCGENGNCYRFKNNQWDTIPKWKETRKKGAGAVLSNGQWLVAGGRSTKGNLLTTTELLHSNLTDSWMSGPVLTVPRENHCIVQLNSGKALIAGGTGSNKDGLTLDLKSVLLYDPNMEELSPASDLNSERVNPSCGFFEEKVYLVGMGKNTVETDIFDPQYQTWIPGPTFPKGAKDQGSLGVYQDKLYYSDGQNIYALENDQWSHKNELSSKAKKYQLSLFAVKLKLKVKDDNNCDFAEI